MSTEVLSVNVAELEQKRNAQFLPATVDKEDDLQYDLGNLLAFDTHPVDTSSLKQNPEKYLVEYSRDNVQLLFNKIFRLPSERVDNGALALLPVPSTPIPRQKPIPKEKAVTKWEEYRRTKGIIKRKRDKMVWDDTAQDWKPRWGHNRANNAEDQWVVEAKKTDDPTVDPFLRMRQDKKKRVEKQLKQQSHNRKRAGTSGPINLLANPPSREKLKEDLETALKVARTATASAGKFDRQLDNEKPLKSKRHYEPVVSKDRSESTKSLQVLEKMLGKDDALDVKKAVNYYTTESQKKRGPGGGGGGKAGGKGQKRRK